MYKSKLAGLIDKAVEDCITYGSGKAKEKINGGVVTVMTEWCYAGEAIEIAIFHGAILYGCVVERIPKEYR